MKKVKDLLRLGMVVTVKNSTKPLNIINGKIISIDNKKETVMLEWEDDKSIDEFPVYHPAIIEIMGCCIEDFLKGVRFDGRSLLKENKVAQNKG